MFDPMDYVSGIIIAPTLSWHRKRHPLVTCPLPSPSTQQVECAGSNYHRSLRGVETSDPGPHDHPANQIFVKSSWLLNRKINQASSNAKRHGEDTFDL